MFILANVCPEVCWMKKAASLGAATQYSCNTYHSENLLIVVLHELCL